MQNRAMHILLDLSFHFVFNPPSAFTIGKPNVIFLTSNSHQSSPPTSLQYPLDYNDYVANVEHLCEYSFVIFKDFVQGA
jgi:hypothetical protein